MKALAQRINRPTSRAASYGFIRGNKWAAALLRSLLPERVNTTVQCDKRLVSYETCDNAITDAFRLNCSRAFRKFFQQLFSEIILFQSPGIQSKRPSGCAKYNEAPKRSSTCCDSSKQSNYMRLLQYVVQADKSRQEPPLGTYSNLTSSLNASHRLCVPHYFLLDHNKRFTSFLCSSTLAGDYRIPKSHRKPPSEPGWGRGDLLRPWGMRRAQHSLRENGNVRAGVRGALPAATQAAASLRCL